MSHLSRTSFVPLVLALLPTMGDTFSPSVILISQRRRAIPTMHVMQRTHIQLNAKSIDDNSADDEILGPLASVVKQQDSDPSNDPQQTGMAATRTVNERLQAELEEMKRKELYGSKSSIGEKMGLNSFASTKTDEERQASIDEAKDLNGVNPVVAISGAFFALVAAGGLWLLTSYLAEVFATHPVETNVYFVQRVASVFRNVVMGLISLSSGFFGVCGMGLLLLGSRVAYGVAKGELDPTPIKTKKQDVDIPNVWDLMTNKKGRRGRRD
ncbi:hypothetical protein MPSEU_000960400 [Mayamaea pseudoterrestris]|nr:hypothetical protein MPSEU_000960400 [Mayamaea pseudoterrestris]